MKTYNTTLTYQLINPCGSNVNVRFSLTQAHLISRLSGNNLKNVMFGSVQTSFCYGRILHLNS